LRFGSASDRERVEAANARDFCAPQNIITLQRTMYSENPFVAISGKRRIPTNFRERANSAPSLRIPCDLYRGSALAMPGRHQFECGLLPDIADKSSDLCHCTSGIRAEAAAAGGE